MTTDIVTYSAMPLDDRTRYANTIAGAASMLPNGIRAGGPDQIAANAFLIMETGAMLDLHPVAALSSVNIIEGKPALSADLMVSVVRNAGHKVRVSEEGSVEGGDYKATVTVVRGDDPDYPVTSVWTPHRAARAGLCKYARDERTGVWSVTALSKNNAPLPWQAYTEALCKARAKSEACRDGAGDSLNGARYTPEELGADVDAAGDPIITSLGAVEPTQAEEAPAALPKATKRATVGKQGTRRRKAADKPAEEPQAAPEQPAEDVVDAEVVDDAEAQLARDGYVEPETLDALASERSEREAMAAEQTRQVTDREAIIATAEQVDRDDEAAVAAWNAEHGKSTGHYLTSTAELARRREAMDAPAPEAEQDAPLFVDEQSGDVYNSQADLDAAIKARVQAKQAERDEQPQQVAVEISGDYDLATAEEPTNYMRRAMAATTVEQTRQVWIDAQADTANPMTTELRMAIVNRKAEIEAAG